MKRKIILRVQMNCQKCRTKALQIAAVADGVSFVGFEGDERDKLAVIGDDVDAANLACSLRKKVGHTVIISVAAVD